MTLEQIRARLAELVAANAARHQAAVDENREMDASEIAAFDEADAEISRLTAQAERAERVAAYGKPNARKTGDEQPGNKAQTVLKVDARTGGFKHLGEFADCVRAAARHDDGAATRLRVAATAGGGMNEGTGEDGGFLVPPEFRDGIMKIVEGEESLLSRCDNSTTAKNSVVQTVDETTPWGTAGINVYWEGEAQAATASKAKLQQNTLRLNKLFARVDVTDELLEDAPQLDNYLRVKTPEVMTQVINLAIVQGNGAGKPLGFMNSNALVTVAAETSQPADTVHHRNIVKMWSRMYAPCRGRSVWLINQDVEPQLNLMSFRDGTTTPVPAYLPPSGLSQSPYGTLLGRPVIPLQAMETVGDLGDIALVDLSQYRAITKAGGMRAETSIHLKFDSDETAFRFIFRLAGNPWWNAPISPRDGSNTLSPFVSLASR